MDTLVLTTLLFDSIGLVVIVLGMALGSFFPEKHRAHPWVRADEAGQSRAAA